MGLLDKALGKVFEPIITQKALDLQKAWKQMPSTDASRSEKSMLWDPMSLVYSLGYKDRRSTISYDVLKRIGSSMSIISAIINTRVNQVSTFTSPYRRTRNIGFEIKHKDPDHRLTKSEKRFIVELESFMTSCGRPKQNKYSPKRRDNFDHFTRKVIRDRMLYDQLCFEVVPDNRGRPFEFLAIDASTIRVAADPKSDKRRDLKKEERDLGPFLDKYAGINMGYPVATTSVKESASFVQLWQGSIIRAYNTEELAFCIANPRTDIKANGYGFSECEQLINIITSQLWAEEYNRNFFKQGASPKGIINIRGDNIAPEQLEAFKRQWLSNVSGVENAWRTPVLQSEEIQYLNMQGSNLDMEYSRWLEYLIKVTCAVFLIAPEEIGFYLSPGGMQQPMVDTNNEWKLKASKDRGLRPLLRFYADSLNRNVIDNIDDKFYLDFIGLDELTERERIELRQQQVQFFRTINEIRSDEDLDPVDDGDIIMNPIYLQKIQMEHSWKVEAEQRKEQKEMQLKQEKAQKEQADMQKKAQEEQAEMQKQQVAQQEQSQQAQLQMQKEQSDSQIAMQQQQVGMQQQQVGMQQQQVEQPEGGGGGGAPPEGQMGQETEQDGAPPAEQIAQATQQAGASPEQAEKAAEEAGIPPEVMQHVLQQQQQGGEAPPEEGQTPEGEAPPEEGTPEGEEPKGSQVTGEEIQNLINAIPPGMFGGKMGDENEGTP